MTKLVFVTQAVDAAHPDLGGTVALVRALAERVDEVVVLALRGNRDSLPENVRLRTFSAGTQMGRGVRLTAALAREMRPRPIGVVAHMSPIYAVISAPVARPFGVGVVLWFTHWRNSALLRNAERVCTAVVTVDSTSFPLRTPKVHAIGHGIDVREFRCADRSGHVPPLRVVVLGRTSRAKGLDVVVQGVKRAQARGVEVELEMRGPSLTVEESEYREALGVVHAPVPRTEIPGLLARSDVLVNNTRLGALDKVVFEACATCLPVLASNPGFVELLDPELRFDRDSPDELADRLEWLSRVGSEERAAIGRRLRARVEASHSVDHWADQVLLSVRRP